MFSLESRDQLKRTITVSLVRLSEKLFTAVDAISDTTVTRTAVDFLSLICKEQVYTSFCLYLHCAFLFDAIEGFYYSRSFFKINFYFNLKSFVLEYFPRSML